MGCSSRTEVQLGSVGVLPISVARRTGAAADADAGTLAVTAMTVRDAAGVVVAVDETTLAYAISITQVQDDTPTNVVGEYNLTFDSTTFADGDEVTFFVSAAVGGVNATGRYIAEIVDVVDERPTLC